MVVLVIDGRRSSKSIESNSCSNSIEQRGGLGVNREEWMRP